MMRIATTTKLTPEEAIDQAVQFFGPEGKGLKITDRSPTCARFQGWGGHVEVTSCTGEDGTSVELISQELDRQVEKFLEKIAPFAKRKKKE